MKYKKLIPGRSVAALCAVAFFGGCATQQIATSSEPPGLKYYALQGENLYADSYDYKITSVGDDGLWYWTEFYHIHYKTKPTDAKPLPNPPQWDSRPGHDRHMKAATGPGTDDAGTDYGWVQITHPGGDYTVTGSETLITHPGGSPAVVTAK